MSVGQAAGELLPGVAAVGGLEDAAVGAVPFAVLPRAFARLPQCGIDDVGVRGIDLHIVAADVLVLVENLLEGLAAVGRAIDAALGIWSVRMAGDRDKQPIGIVRIDRHCRDLLAVAQAQDASRSRRRRSTCRCRRRRTNQADAGLRRCRRKRCSDPKARPRWRRSSPSAHDRRSDPRCGRSRLSSTRRRSPRRCRRRSAGWERRQMARVRPPRNGPTSRQLHLGEHLRVDLLGGQREGRLTVERRKTAESAAQFRFIDIDRITVYRAAASDSGEAHRESVIYSHRSLQGRGLRLSHRVRRVSCFSAPLLLLATFLNIARTAQTVSPATISGLQWRLIGPFRGGRAAAVTGVPGGGAPSTSARSTAACGRPSMPA